MDKNKKRKKDKVYCFSLFFFFGLSTATIRPKMTIVWLGYVASSSATLSNGVATHLCMHKVPQYLEYNDSDTAIASNLFRTEYKTNITGVPIVLASLHDYEGNPTNVFIFSYKPWILFPLHGFSNASFVNHTPNTLAFIFK
jgi:hypothetical protein